MSIFFPEWLGGGDILLGELSCYFLFVWLIRALSFSQQREREREKEEKQKKIHLSGEKKLTKGQEFRKGCCKSYYCKSIGMGVVKGRSPSSMEGPLRYSILLFSIRSISTLYFFFFFFLFFVKLISTFLGKLCLFCLSLSACFFVWSSVHFVCFNFNIVVFKSSESFVFFSILEGFLLTFFLAPFPHLLFSYLSFSISLPPYFSLFLV